MSTSRFHFYEEKDISIKQKSLDAILTYWPYQAKLMTDDSFSKVINITDIMLH